MDDTKQECQRLATVEVVRFMELQVHPKVTGREMLQELLKVYPEGIPEVSNGISILPREVAALIPNKSCHAVYFHPMRPLKRNWQIHDRSFAKMDGRLQLVLACAFVPAP